MMRDTLSVCIVAETTMVRLYVRDLNESARLTKDSTLPLCLATPLFLRYRSTLTSTLSI